MVKLKAANAATMKLAGDDQVVLCPFSWEHADRLAGFRPGQLVCIQGVCGGIQVRRHIELKECSVVDDPTDLEARRILEANRCLVAR